MASFLRLPRLYPEMEDATIGRWAVQPGETISPHAPIVEIITDKVSYDVEGPEGELTEGVVLLEACAPEKSVLPVGSVVAVLGSPGESAADSLDWRSENAAVAARRRSELGEMAAAPVSAPTAAVEGPAAVPAAVPAAGGVIRATPSARRAAKAAGIALEEIAAQASGATVTEADVERFLAGRAGS